MDTLGSELHITPNVTSFCRPLVWSPSSGPRRWCNSLSRDLQGAQSNGPYPGSGLSRTRLKRAALYCPQLFPLRTETELRGPTDQVSVRMLQRVFQKPWVCRILIVLYTMYLYTNTLCTMIYYIYVCTHIYIYIVRESVVGS